MVVIDLASCLALCGIENHVVSQDKWPGIARYFKAKANAQGGISLELGITSSVVGIST